MISKSDFDTWKADPVTKAFMEACHYRIEDAKDILATSAGLDNINDNFTRGFISAYNEIQNFRYEDAEGIDA
jgi:hypothetical protein